MEARQLPQLSSLRLGILCPGVRLPAWQADCLTRLLALERVEIAALALYAVTPMRDARGGLLWRIFRERIVQRRARSARPVDLTDRLAHVPVVQVDLGLESGLGSLRQEDVATLRGLDLDVLLYLGEGSLAGDMLEVARYGVWAFCWGACGPGARERGDGLPTALGEMLRGEEITAASLRRLGPAGSSALLREGFVRTCGAAYCDALDAVTSMSAVWPAQVCADLCNGRAAYLVAPCVGPPSAAARPPRGGEVLGLVWAMAAHRVRRMVDRYLFFPQWGIGLVGQPIAAFLDPGPRPPTRWLPSAPPCTFWADPFALQRQDGIEMLFEDYDYAQHKGRVAALSVSDTASDAHRLVMDQPWHLSYPYLLEHEGQVYCVPESAEAGEIGLFQAERYPDTWVKVATLVAGFPGADGTLFFHQGRWWLLAIDVSRQMDHELYAWHAPQLLGPWEPHANNPIKVDVRSSRPAGTPFVHEGRLYRPAQDCSRGYGGRVVINWVRRLTPTEFEEEIAASVEPDPLGPYPDGLHTLSAVGDVTLIDGKKNVLIVSNWHMVRHGLRTIPRRVRAVLFRGEANRRGLPA